MTNCERDHCGHKKSEHHFKLSKDDNNNNVIVGSCGVDGCFCNNFLRFKETEQNI